MKHYSKIVALLLAFILMVMPGAGMVSADVGVSVTTGSGAALGDSIDMKQKTLNVNFVGAVDEAKLATGVKVLTDATTETVLHIEKKEAGNPEYATNVQFIPSEPLTGKMTLSFSYKWTGTRYPVIYFYRTNGGSSSNAILEKILIDDTYWKKLANSYGLTMGSTAALPTGITSTKGQWVDFVLDFNIERASGPAYDFSMNGISRNSLVGCNHYTADGSKDISKIVIGPDDGSGAVADLSIKNFKITHTVSGTTTTYAPNYSKAQGETGFDFVYGGSIGNSSTATVESVLKGDEVTMARSYQNGVYTLTKADNWNTSKDYKLVISKDVTGAAQDTVYDFTAADLGGLSGVTTADDGIALGSEIDLSQKAINIQFAGDVNSSALPSNIKVLTDVNIDKILHMYSTDANCSQYGVYMQRRQESSPYTTGTVTLNCSFKYTGERYPQIFLMDGVTAGTYFQGFSIDNAKYGYQYKDNGSSFSQLIDMPGVSDTEGRWVDVEISVDLSASPKTYTFKVDGVTILENKEFPAGKVPSHLGEFRFYGGQNAAGAVDIMWKDIKITHKASASAAPSVVEPTITVGQLPSFFTAYGSDITAKEAMTGVDVTMKGSYNEGTKTYTLTNEGDWDPTKTYKLVIGKDILGATNDAEYNFVVRNLRGSLILDGITTAGGATLADGGYLPASEPGINLMFSENVDSNTLSGIKLEKIDADKILHMYSTDANCGQYGVYMNRRQESSPYTTGTVTLNCSFKYTGERYPQIFLMDGVTAGTYFQGFSIDNEKYGYQYKDDGSNFSQLIAMQGVSDTEGRWVDVEISVDLSASPKTYTFKVDGVTILENKEFPVGKVPSHLGEFRFYGGQNAKGAVDIMWKDIKITHKASASAAPSVVEPTITAGQLPSFFTAYGSDITAKDLVTLTELDVEYANDPTTSTVTVIPETAFEYLGTYKLTVPTTVATEGGANLLAGAEIDFTAIYADSLYSAAAGFKAGATEITTISSTFTGDITGWAHITNIGDAPKNAVLIVALYLNDALVDIDIVPVNNIGAGQTVTDKTGTVTIGAEEAAEGYEAAVFVWDSTTNLYPVANKATTK